MPAKTKSSTSSVTVSPGAVDVGPVAVADTTGFAVGDKVQFTYQVVNKDTGATTTSAPVMGTIKTLGAGITITPDTAVPATRYIIPSGTVIAKAMVPASTTWSKLDAAGVPNWKKARDYGPGSYPKPAAVQLSFSAASDIGHFVPDVLLNSRCESSDTCQNCHG